uniref:Uncharacterized protein n=1 Tax=Salix viminalis TaxID=40686 RepID=A0A6N2MSU4_SALVM
MTKLLSTQKMIGIIKCAWHICETPLSGPLVTAEAPGGEKSSKNPIKVKDHFKKDKYLLKRRDEPSEPRAFEIDKRQASSSSLAVYAEVGSSAVESGDFVLQKRDSTPHISAKHEQSVLITKEDVDSSEDGAGKAVLVLDHALGDANFSLDKKGAMQEIKGEPGSDVAVGLMSTGRSDLPGKEQLEGVSDCKSVLLQQQEAIVDLKYEEGATASRSNQVSQKNEPRFSARAEVDSGLIKLHDGEPGSLLSPLNATHSVGTSTGNGVKKSTLAQAVVTSINVCAMIFIIIAGSYLGFKTGWAGYELPAGYFPFGVNGMLAGSATRDLPPLGIGLALSVCCCLYMMVSVVIVGLVPYYAMDPDTPISSAFAAYGMQWAA